MRKIIVAVLAAGTFTVGACGGAPEDTQNQSAPANATEPAKPAMSLTRLDCGTEAQWSSTRSVNIVSFA